MHDLAADLRSCRLWPRMHIRIKSTQKGIAARPVCSLSPLPNLLWLCMRVCSYVSQALDPPAVMTTQCLLALPHVCRVKLLQAPL